MFYAIMIRSPPNQKCWNSSVNEFVWCRTTWKILLRSSPLQTCHSLFFFSLRTPAVVFSSPPLLSLLKKCYILAANSIPKAKGIISSWHFQNYQIFLTWGGWSSLSQSKSHLKELRLWGPFGISFWFVLKLKNYPPHHGYKQWYVASI